MSLRSLERLAVSRAVQQLLKSQSVRLGSTAAFDPMDARVVIGKREVVGFGHNGGMNYMDREDFPMPAIRFREPTNAILALREKEKGDWKQLSVEEKKALYRASFCQTFAELNAPTGEWKLYLSGVIFLFSCACWLYMTMKKFVLPATPASFAPEAQQAQLKKMIALEVDPIYGLSSKWDYEKGEWKK